MHASGPRPPVIVRSASSTSSRSKFKVSAPQALRASASRSATRSIAMTRDAPSSSRRLHGEQAHRAGAPDGHDVARRDVAVLCGHVAGREDVGQKQHLIVSERRRHLERPDVGEGHAHVLRLPSRVTPIDVRVAEEPAARVPVELLGHPGVGIRVVAQRPEAPTARPQFPHAMVKGTTTRSPGETVDTPRPTSTTSPMNSWPRMSPAAIDGMKPSYRCRSDPQMAVEVTRTMASRGLRILGSGTCSTRTSCVPYQHSAFMASPAASCGTSGSVDRMTGRRSWASPRSRATV